jgi:hypothetical protein
VRLHAGLVCVDAPFGYSQSRWRRCESYVLVADPLTDRAQVAAGHANRLMSASPCCRQVTIGRCA